MPYCIIVIGMTGQGKSKFVKEYIGEKACHVFDVQREYNNLSLNYRDSRSRNITMKESSFIVECEQKRNSILVFEEATGFFEGKLDKEVRRLVLSKRHTGNILIFCFHSISSVPPRLMQFCNYVILYKTNDEPYQVEQKFPSLVPFYNAVKTAPLYSFKTIQMIPQ